MIAFFPCFVLMLFPCFSVPTARKIREVPVRDSHGVAADSRDCDCLLQWFTHVLKNVLVHLNILISVIFSYYSVQMLNLRNVMDGRNKNMERSKQTKKPPSSTKPKALTKSKQTNKNNSQNKLLSIKKTELVQEIGAQLQQVQCGRLSCVLLKVLFICHVSCICPVQDVELKGSEL